MCFIDVIKDVYRLTVCQCVELIVVRILIPTLASSTIAPAAPITQAAQSRAELAIQDREEAAIQVHVSTLAPQTPYSTPKVVWRPDGSGVWVNGDDGVLRGLESTTGKSRFFNHHVLSEGRVFLLEFNLA